MFGLGFSEIVFLAILGLVVIGPKQLPEVARTLGRFLNELRRSTSVFTDELKAQTKFDPFDLKSPPIPKPQPPPGSTTEAKTEFNLTPETMTASSSKPEPHADKKTRSDQPELPVQTEFPLDDRDDGKGKA